jgi:hypothetical protein
MAQIVMGHKKVEGETIFSRKQERYQKFVHEGGDTHIERIYASGGMIVTILHNYATNDIETRYLSIDTAMERFYSLRDMRRNSPEWVSEDLLPAILKAVKAAQKQQSLGLSIFTDVGDAPLDEGDIEGEMEEIWAAINEERAKDPELDAQMRDIETNGAKSFHMSEGSKSNNSSDDIPFLIPGINSKKSKNKEIITSKR